MGKSERPDNEIVGDIWSEIWDVEAVAKSLNAEVSLYKDVMYGCGYKLSFRDPVELQLFPENHLMSIRRPYFKLDMSNVTDVEPLEGKVRIEASDAQTKTTVVFESTGTIFFNCSDRPQRVPAPKLEAAPLEAPKAESPKEEKKEDERITLFGRIGLRKGTELQITTTNSGKKLLKFPLAVTEDEKTVYHDVIFYDEKAEKVLPILQEARERHQSISLVGFKKQGEREVKKGNTTFKKMVSWINGVAVQASKSKEKGTSDS